ncbi:BON domain-containing protein [Luteimonas composti]|uniref:BON domain-containing protein n=1 Tax=Luteimonas composti TaxID=398257 RepID=A0ABT6MS87_9GAMM|nr:BON domain-containing protein [Luteimonas composti]MDH7453479.1 BON domain-containing protein [Luteimonas composti]
MDDTWIATRVKTELLASRGVSGLALNVETTDGVASLTGELGSQSELDKAVQVARGVDGVVRVDTSGIRISADADR